MGPGFVLMSPAIIRSINLAERGESDRRGDQRLALGFLTAKCMASAVGCISPPVFPSKLTAATSWGAAILDALTRMMHMETHDTIRWLKVRWGSCFTLCDFIVTMTTTWAKNENNTE